MVLVAEDEAINRMYICSLLHRRNISYREAASGQAALELVTGGEYELLLLDLGLPDMDGYDLLAQIRLAGIAAPAVAVTGRDYPEDQDAMQKAGFQGIIAKPIQEYVFWDEIEKHLTT